MLILATLHFILQLDWSLGSLHKLNQLLLRPVNQFFDALGVAILIIGLNRLHILRLLSAIFLV